MKSLRFEIKATPRGNNNIDFYEQFLKDREHEVSNAFEQVFQVMLPTINFVTIETKEKRNEKIVS